MCHAPTPSYWDTPDRQVIDGVQVMTEVSRNAEQAVANETKIIQ